MQLITNKFKNNKYTKWYISIIENAYDRNLEKDLYVEKHHIIPKSLKGTNDKSNIYINS
jgi:hypothetical protein